jgi:hypothetical protein
MSGARAGAYVLSAAEIEALVREQQRLGLCAAADTLAARQGRLADRAARVAAAFDVDAVPVPTLGVADRANVEALERFVAGATELLDHAEHQLTERCMTLRRQMVARSLHRLADHAAAMPEPQPAVDPKHQAADPARIRQSAPAASPRTSKGAPAAPPDRTRARDLEAAADLMAGLDDRVADTSFLQQIVQEIEAAPAGQRHLLLRALTAEVRDRNERVREDAAVRGALAALAARAAQLEAPAPAAVVATAIAEHAAGRAVDLTRIEATVYRAEIMREEHERLDRARDLVAAEFAARGYTVFPGAEVFTAEFGILLQSEVRPSYGVGIDVSDDVISFTTVRLVDDADGRRTGQEQADREHVCHVIGEISTEISGLTIEDLTIVGDDAEVRVPASASRRRKARPVEPLRANHLPAP